MAGFATIDTTSLDEAVAMALRVTTQEPRNLVLNVGRGIALRAKALTPFVRQETIDTELGVISTPILSTRGKRKGLPLKSGRQNYQLGAPSAEEQGPEFLAMRIVLARMWPHTPYNQRTHQRWAIDRMQFSPGAGVVGFWRKVQQTAKRMVASRHSSTHFLQAGWSAVYRKLTGLRYGGTSLVQESVIDVDAEVTPEQFNDLGDVSLFGSGSSVSLVLENLVGMKGVNAISYNVALHKHGEGPLQAAANEKAAELQTRYLPQWESELARRWNAVR